MSMMQRMRDLGQSVTDTEVSKEIVSRVDQNAFYQINRVMDKIVLDSKDRYNREREMLYKDMSKYSSPKAINSHEFESKKVLTYHNKH